MPIQSRASRIIAGAVAGVLVAGGGTAAFAYWTASGSGTGTATTGTSLAFVVVSDPATGGPLTPGGSPVTVPFAVSHLGTGTQVLSSIVVTVATSTGADWTTTPGCSALDYTVGIPVITYGDIAAGGEITGTVTVTMNDRPVNQDGCKNASVPLYMVAS